MRALGIKHGSARSRSVGSAVLALTSTDLLPGLDGQTDFIPKRAFVRRVPGQNLWLLYRFDDQHVEVLAIRETPPIPSDQE